MPQITQLPLFYVSQLFWLLLVFGTIFFVIGRGMLPKIQATVEARDARIAQDLAEAERARAQADTIEADYRARIDESRMEALRVTEASKQDSARETEARIKAADAEIGARTDAAEAEIRAATAKAMRDIEKVAAETAGEMVQKLAGLKIGADRAAAAVKVALNG
jgi:F-type H+-transporting ATPase subunit b